MGEIMRIHFGLKNMLHCFPVTLTLFACLPEQESKRSKLSSQTHEENEDDKLLLALPFSPVGPFNSEQWSFQTSDLNTAPPAGADTWLGLDEKQVFFKRLTHTQKSVNWTMKVGKGGQIYSITTPETGEMVAIQRKDHGQWIDEVFQHVIPSALYQKDASHTIIDGDIHQAGYYTRSDLYPLPQILPESVYSPVFPATYLEFIKANDSFALTTWPQHAHLPRQHSENGMLMHQMMRDLGDGVVEVTLRIDKWKGVETLDINLPWSAWRPQNLPSMLVSNPDGSFTENNQSFAKTGDGQRKLFKKDRPNWSPDTGGWIALAQSNSASSMGIGIVFGKYASAIEGDASYLRWGNYSEDKPEEGTTVTVKRNIPLLPGDSVFARYFLVIGSVSKIQHYGNLLQSRVELGRVKNDELQSGMICIAQDALQKMRRGCPQGTAPLFYTYRDFQPNSQPLFLLGRRDGSHVLTNNPYEISSNPTDGQTTSYSFLGWALTKGSVPTFRYMKLSELKAINRVQVSSKILPLNVRSPTR